MRPGCFVLYLFVVVDAVAGDNTCALTIPPRLHAAKMAGWVGSLYNTFEKLGDNLLANYLLTDLDSSSHAFYYFRRHTIVIYAHREGPRTDAEIW